MSWEVISFCFVWTTRSQLDAHMFLQLEQPPLPLLSRQNGGFAPLLPAGQDHTTPQAWEGYWDGFCNALFFVNQKPTAKKDWATWWRLWTCLPSARTRLWWLSQLHLSEACQVLHKCEASLEGQSHQNFVCSSSRLPSSCLAKFLTWGFPKVSRGLRQLQNALNCIVGTWQPHKHY
jgi:hypothetical protein